jgi:2-isopropylmalate synthase
LCWASTPVALRQALENLGIEIQGQALNTAFRRFKEIADRKKTITAMDLEALLTDELREQIAGFTLESYELEAGTEREPRAVVTVRTPAGQSARGEFSGDGSVDSVFGAINAATGVDASLREFRIDAVTEGQDALGEVSVVVRVGEDSASGQGVATDIVEAAARAYLRALTTLARGGRTVTKPESAPADLAAAP